ncbi:MAG: magnesium transporter MgtE N-terminal domain-containing protein [Candidatus Binatia bacterium]
MDAEFRLCLSFLKAHAREACRILEGLPLEDSAAFLAEIPPEQVAATLQAMAPLVAAELLTRLPDERGVSVLSAMLPGSAAALLRRLSPQRRERLLQGLPQERQTRLKILVTFPEDSAGALMDPHIPAFPADLTAGEARQNMRRLPVSPLSSIFVVDRAQKLVGKIALAKLIACLPKQRLETVMSREMDILSAHAQGVEISTHPGWLEEPLLPVIDGEGNFLGGVRYETLRRLEGRAPARAPSPLATALTLGEVFWIGLLRLVEELVALLPVPKTTRLREG